MAIVEWLSMHPLLKTLFCKNNNEGKKTPQQGHFAKRLGLRPGVSDLFIYYPTKTYPGLWLEVKRNKKYTKSERESETWLAQINFQNIVKSVGYHAEFCYGFDHGREIIEAYIGS